jgi:hypothetical protein
MRDAILVFAAALLSAVFSLTGQMILSSRGHDAKLIEIAIGVLRAEPKPETEAVRTWAIPMINATSVPLTKTEEQSLLKHAIPFVIPPVWEWDVDPRKNLVPKPQ